MNTHPATTEETTVIILAGDGYQLTISPETEARKLQLIKSAELVTTVTSNEESSSAQFVGRKLAQMRIEVEKSRKAVKEPVNRIGRLIDETAKNFVSDIEVEEKRINKLVGDHATEQARLKLIKEEEERKAFEDARRAREEALVAQEAAEAAKSEKQGIAAVLAAQEAAKAAEAARQEALATRMEASAEVAGTKVADGVRFAWDFEVENIDQLAASHRELVNIEPRRSDILALIKDMEARFPNQDIAASFADIGLKVFKKPVVSSR